MAVMYAALLRPLLPLACLRQRLKRPKAGVAVTVFKVPGKRPESQPESLAGLQMDAKVLLLLAAGPMSKSELSAALGQKQVSGQFNKLMCQLQASGQIEATVPGKPNSRLQRYQLSVQFCQRNM